jgi:gp16 family phage-associated protein
MKNKTETLQKVKDEIQRCGLTAVDIAKRAQAHPATVRAVLNGRLPGRRGSAHRIAVVLGIKSGECAGDVDGLLARVRRVAQEAA